MFEHGLAHAFGIGTPGFGAFGRSGDLGHIGGPAQGLEVDGLEEGEFTGLAVVAHPVGEGRVVLDGHGDEPVLVGAALEKGDLVFYFPSSVPDKHIHTIPKRANRPQKSLRLYQTPYKQDVRQIDFTLS